VRYSIISRYPHVPLPSAMKRATPVARVAAKARGGKNDRRGRLGHCRRRRGVLRRLSSWCLSSRVSSTIRIDRTSEAGAGPAACPPFSLTCHCRAPPSAARRTRHGRCRLSRMYPLAASTGIGNLIIELPAGLRRSARISRPRACRRRAETSFVLIDELKSRAHCRHDPGSKT
jgi:hypothetical protein